eukprot:CAMPEP_0194268774 /NCGR_PEP_ID=MMETSP0169-20130528/3045_1 /TAXON_ID=218684 /ORGANISM="Corethron pennatum, Strain L29A3" /LENGTH=612 /DNA_ID=CAMNT_0039010149 /DNA_START=151 /DNA_END=1989 /DNA_ORIENTATION=-
MAETELNPTHTTKRDEKTFITTEEIKNGHVKDDKNSVFSSDKVRPPHRFSLSDFRPRRNSSTDEFRPSRRFSVNDLRPRRKSLTFSFDEFQPPLFSLGEFRPPLRRRSSVVETELKPTQTTKRDEKVLQRSILVLYLAVFINYANRLALSPVIPILTEPGLHKDSFESIGPFVPFTAFCFIGGLSNLGSFFANIIGGTVSDKVGRKPVIMAALCGSIISQIAIYFMRNSFWGFSVSTFFLGLFTNTATLAFGYLSDVIQDRTKLDSAMTRVVVIGVSGTASGGLFAAAFHDSLFIPTLPLAALEFIVLLLIWKFFIECKRGETSEEDSNEKTSELHHPTFWTIIFGALLDNVGSMGIFPLCFNPLMFETYYLFFVEQQLTPVMNETTYKLLYVFMAIVAVPGAIAAPFCYKKFGVAMSTVAANIVTGFTIIALLFITKVEPATNKSFAGFVTILYVFFPVTIISQVAVGPMLDRIVPPHKIGWAQGVNMSCQDIPRVFVPFLGALLIERKGVDIALWITFVVSLLAAIVNLPLIWNPRLLSLNDIDDKDKDKESSIVERQEEETKQKVHQVDNVPAAKYTLNKQINPKVAKTEGMHLLAETGFLDETRIQEI